MNYLFLQYPKCSTCRNAKKWLDGQQVSYTDRHIIDNNPTAEELKKWIASSGLPIKSFFNTSGEVYKSMQLKDKLASLSEDEQIELLASNGKLVKRPLLIGNDKVIVGFKVDAWIESVK